MARMSGGGCDRVRTGPESLNVGNCDVACALSLHAYRGTNCAGPGQRQNDCGNRILPSCDPPNRPEAAEDYFRKDRYPPTGAVRGGDFAQYRYYRARIAFCDVEPISPGRSQGTVFAPHMGGDTI